MLEANLEAAHSDAFAFDPQDHREALRRSDADLWHAAMLDETVRLNSHDPWEIVDRPPGANVVGSQWVYRAKRDTQNRVQDYRSRLVAQGYSQREGVDFFSDDTIAPVAKMSSQRASLALAAQRGYLIRQVDVRSAYLYGHLSEEETIYMCPPPLMPIDGLNPGQVFRLKVSLYGLRQSGRRWAFVLREIMAGFGLKRSEHDHAVFYRHSGQDFVIVSAHVDDLTLIAPDEKSMKVLTDRIKSRVETKEIGDLHWMLGIEIKRSLERRTISLTQRAYIDQILSRYGFEDVKPLSLSMDPHIQFSTDQCPTTPEEMAVMRDKPFRQALGALMYASVATRPDITYAVSQLARYAANPGIAHWTALKRVYAYLKGTRDFWLVLGGDPAEPLNGYSDANGMSTEGRQAISGFAFLIGGAVSWSSKRQDIVAQSTFEAEYVALSHAFKEVLWLRNLLQEVWQMPMDPTTLYSDNQSAIALAKDDRYHLRTKHIDIRYHFIRYHIERNEVVVTYCPTEDMVADILTKALPSMKAKHFASCLGLAKA